MVRVVQGLRACRSEVIRRRLECIGLTKLDYARFTIAEVVGVSDTTVRDTVRRFNELIVACVGDEDCAEGFECLENACLPLDDGADDTSG